VPVLALAPESELPWLGSNIELRIGNLLPGQAGAMFLGASSTAWGTVRLPLDLTAFGMTGIPTPSVKLPLPRATNAAVDGIRIGCTRSGWEWARTSWSLHKTARGEPAGDENARVVTAP
jgi:hypothetical protein